MRCRELDIEECFDCRGGSTKACYIKSYIRLITGPAGFDYAFAHVRTFPQNAVWFLAAVEQGKPDRLDWVKKMLPLL